MASSQNTDTPVAVKARNCRELLERLTKIASDSEYIAKEDAVDLLGRFKIWARNIGALELFESRTSLDSRPCENPKASNLITELLEDFVESIKDACSIASHERENRTGVLDSNFDMEAGSTYEEGEGDKEISEIEEIMGSLSGMIGHLFRFQADICNNLKVDLHVKAQTAATTKHP